MFAASVRIYHTWEIGLKSSMFCLPTT